MNANVSNDCFFYRTRTCVSGGGVDVFHRPEVNPTCRNDTLSMHHIYTGVHVSLSKYMCQHNHTSTLANIQSFQSKYGLWYSKLARFWMSLKSVEDRRSYQVEQAR